MAEQSVDVVGCSASNLQVLLIVAQLREMRARRLSLGQIAAELQAEGVPTLSGKGLWQKGTVAKLLIQ
jgi:hypothetical protein